MDEPCLIKTLVGGLEHSFYDFPYILGIILIIPTDDLYHFSEGQVTYQMCLIWIKFQHWNWICLNNRWTKTCIDGTTVSQWPRLRKRLIGGIPIPYYVWPMFQA